MMLIETLRSLVFGIYEHGEHTQIYPGGTKHRVCQEDAAESFALMVLVHREPPQQRGRDNRVPGQLPDDVWSQSA